MEETLFSNRVKRPLADRLRPRKLEEVVGQEQVLGEDSPLGRMLFTGRISSFILWGPPGCGKTTIARLIAEHTNLYFEQISAVFSGKKAVPKQRKPEILQISASCLVLWQQQSWQQVQFCIGKSADKKV